MALLATALAGACQPAPPAAPAAPAGTGPAAGRGWMELASSRSAPVGFKKPTRCGGGRPGQPLRRGHRQPPHPEARALSEARGFSCGAARNVAGTDQSWAP